MERRVPAFGPPRTHRWTGRRLTILLGSLTLLPAFLLLSLFLLLPHLTTAQTQPSTTTSWRDSFDTWDNLYSQSNVDVVSGSLTLAPDNKWIQTTEADFRSASRENTEASAVPGSVGLQREVGFTLNTRVSDDLGRASIGSPDVAIDNHGISYAIWYDYRNDPQGSCGYISCNSDIYFAYRPQGGNWGTPIRVNDDNGGTQQISPAMVVDGAGNAYAVWVDNRNGNSDIYFASRSAGGLWSANTKISDDSGAAAQINPDIALDSQGNVYVVWHDRRAAPDGILGDVYFTSRSVDDGRWAPSARINEVPLRADADPVIAVDPVGNVYVAWTDYRNEPLGGCYVQQCNSDVYLVYRPAGGAWQPNTRVNDDNHGYIQGGTAVATDSYGNAYVIWTSGPTVSGGGDLYFASHTSGGGWSPGQRINDVEGYVISGKIGVDNDGNAYAAWRDQRGDEDNIYFAYRPARGDWGTNVRVNDTARRETPQYARIGVSQIGRSLVVWLGGPWEHNAMYGADLLLSGNYYPLGTITSPIHNSGQTSEWATIAWDATLAPETSIFFQTRTGNAPAPDSTWSPWSAPYAPSPAPITSPAARYIQYRATLSSGHGADTPFLRSVTITYISHKLVHTSSTDFSGSMTGLEIATDGSLRLSHPYMMPNSMVNDTAFHFGEINMASTDSGNIYALWRDKYDVPIGFDSFEYHRDLYFTERPVSGTWSSNIKVNDSSTVEGEPAFTVDHFGNSYAIWPDDRGGEWGLYSAFRPTGGSWSSNVRASDNAAVIEGGGNALTVDGASTVYAAWIDGRAGWDKQDVYFSTRLPTGGWSVSSKINDDAATSRKEWLAMGASHRGDLYVAWVDYRHDPDGRCDGTTCLGHIYFAYKPAGGVWSQAVRVTDDQARLDQFPRPRLAVHRNGGAYLVWTDYRNDPGGRCATQSCNGDIYLAYRPAGGNWGTNVRMNDDTGSTLQTSPYISVDEAGNAYLAWTDYRNEPVVPCHTGDICNSDIYMTRWFSSEGRAANVKVNDDSITHQQDYPAIAAAGTGDTYILWRDNRHDPDGQCDPITCTYDIYSAHLLPYTTFYPQGNLVSAVYDTVSGGIWGSITYAARTAQGTSVGLRTRSGNSSTPDPTWSVWSPILTNGRTTTTPAGHYLQYQLYLSTMNPYTTPLVSRVTIDWMQFRSSGSAQSTLITLPHLAHWDRLNFTASTTTATSIAVDVLDPDGNVLLSNVGSGASLASIDARRYPAIRLRARLFTNDPTQTPRLDEWSVSWTLPPLFVTVRDDDGHPLPNADVLVFRTGARIARATTDPNGQATFDALQPGDTLVALALQHQQPSAKPAHDGWAYRVYRTSLDVQPTGEVTPFVVRSAGEQTLVVKRTNPLVLFNLVVSVEWNAYRPADLHPEIPFDTFLKQLRRSLRAASDYLYDATDGQFAFGQITVYEDGRHWADADLQVLASDQTRPSSVVGGITASSVYTYTSSAGQSSVYYPGFFRLGRAWNRYAGLFSPLDQPDAFRTLVHEFGHYGLYLYDEYEYLTPTGDLRPAHCTSEAIRTNLSERTNGSLMDWQYNATELAMRGSQNWSASCEQTVQYQVHGESDWETLRGVYGDTQRPTRWTFTTPADLPNGAPNPGPDFLPLDYPLITVVEGRLTQQDKVTLDVKGSSGNLEPSQRVEVYSVQRQGGQVRRILDQGSPNSEGKIELLGLGDGDELKAVNWDGSLFTSQVFHSTAPLVLQPSHWNPMLDTRPLAHGAGLSLALSQTGALLASPRATLIEVGGGFSQTLTLTPSATGTYSGTFQFEPTRPAKEGHLWLRGVTAEGQTVETVTTYAIGGAPGSHERSYPPIDPASSDGNLELHIPNGGVPDNTVVIVMPTRGVPPVPSGLRVVGTPYNLRASGGVAGMGQPGALTMFYSQEAVSGVERERLAIYTWNEGVGRWESQGGVVDGQGNFISAPVTRFGLYAIMLQPTRAYYSYLPHIERQTLR